MLSRHFIFFAALPLLTLTQGCKDKQEIQVYRVAKAELESPSPAPMAGGGSDSMPPMGGMPGMPGMPGAGGGQGGMGAESGAQLTGSAPANWEAQPPSAMRQASYLVKGENGASADVSLVALGGSAGGTLENVNRWLGQLGQAPITEEKLGQIAQHVSSSLGDILVVDLEGLPQGADPAKDGRILAGIGSVEGKTLFFKMRGNAALVESQKEAFTKWVGSVHAGESAPTAAPSAAPTAGQPSDPHASLAPMPGAAEQSQDASKPQVKYEVPAGWKPVAASSMRYASFAVTGQNEETGDISVSVFPGDTGGDLANVNRWRAQVGLAPIEAAELNSNVTNVSGVKCTLKVVDLSGEKTRVLAAWAPDKGNTWFFKLTGPATLVGSEKEKFMKFLQSVQFTP